MKEKEFIDSGGFDRIAPIYDRLARLVFGETLLTARTVNLDHVVAGNRVLVLGGGTGEILPDLLQRVGEEGQILYVEASEKMILHAANRIENHPRNKNVSFLYGTQESIPNGSQFDRIISNFFLDLFEPQRLNKVFDLLHSFLLPSGKWLIADFSLPNSAWRIPAHILIKAMYLFFRICCGIKGKRIQDFSLLFTAKHYQIVHQEHYWKGLIFSAVYQKDTY